MNKAKPVIALNLPETGLEPKAYAFDNKRLKAFIDMVDDSMLGIAQK